MKTYWTILNKENRYYCVGKGGWEICIRNEEYINHLGKKVSYQAIDMPKECPREARADFRKKLARDKRVAQAVNTREEYIALWQRIDDENWDFIEKENLTGNNLRSWAYGTRTADEYDRLLRYN